MMPLFLLASYHVWTIWVIYRFSTLIHSLMNFYIGTTQAGDNKFVSLMLVCARHMAKPSGAARNT